MLRVMLAVAAALGLLAAPAVGVPRDTTVRTIQDRDGDNLLEFAEGEDYTVVGAPQDFRPPRTGSLLNFLQLSDFQIVDEESPGRVEFLDGSQRIPGLNPFSAAYRPQESLTTQITEAMVRQARNTTSPVTGEQLDLAILTGDNADSQQYNETRWFIDILDGTTGSKAKIDPNSGVEGTCGTVPDGSLYDGVRGNGSAGPDNGYYEPDSSEGEDGDGYSPRREQNAAETGGRDVTVRDFPGLFEDAQRPFEALGLDMPWYSAFGNHDALVQGNSSEAFVGPFGSGGETLNPGYDQMVRGCLKPSKLPAGVSEEEFLQDLPGNLAGSQPAVVPRDDRRCYLAKDTPVGALAPCEKGWIREHFETTGTPVGHGFANRPREAVANHDGYYSFKPREGVRFVVLDTITDECGALVCAEGSVDDEQYRWAEAEISEAAGLGEYVLLFSHHTLRTTRMVSVDATEQPIHFGEHVDHKDGQLQPPSAPETTVEDLLCRHANVLGMVNGHEHQNYVLEHDCSESVGKNAFYEISTVAHIDYPQQSRMIELVQNQDRTLSLALTILDHDGPPNPGGSKSEGGGDGSSGESTLRLASIGREIAFNDYQGSRGAGGDPEDRNVIIKTSKPWPPPRTTPPPGG